MKLDTTKLINNIYDNYKASRLKESRRQHLGASVIGEPCKRNIYYEFRWYKNDIDNGRILRLFETGKKEEARILADLMNTGFIFNRTDNGEQIGFIDKSGHIGGSVDALVYHIPTSFGALEDDGTCILEIKTHNDKNFNKLNKDGVQVAFPKHYSQVQYYMGSMNINYAIYVAVNKNTDDLYIEPIKFDQYTFDHLKAKAEEIILSDALPPKISESPSWFTCKMCKFYNLCHGEAVPDKSCRSCVHSVPKANGAWGCDLHKKKLSYEDQVKACDDYKVRQ